MPAIAIVTGSASGIGRATAFRLAADGFAVALLDLNENGVEQAATELTQAGHQAIGVRTDVTDFSGMVSVRERVVAALGTPAVVVNCAGWSVVQNFVDNDEAFWRKAVDINLMGTVNVTRAFLDGMIGQGGGAVVNVASDAGRVGSSGETVYAAAKGGVIAFGKSLAREMARHKITVNTVCPGPTSTPMLMVQDEKRIDALTRAIPMRRLAEPADIANAVAFFANPSSGYVTGQVLSVSGGLAMAG